jgi:hypothetical protein
VRDEASDAGAVGSTARAARRSYRASATRQSLVAGCAWSGNAFRGSWRGPEGLACGGGWHEGWTSATGKIRKALLPRLEARLAICVQRAGAAGIDVKSVLDVVAVVGVVSEDACQEGVEAQLSRPTCPHAHLRAMFLARRFVFFLCVAAIPAGAPVLAAASPGST